MTESFWQKRNGRKVFKAQKSEKKSRYDIAIIGGGIVGTAVAHFLKKLGCSNTVILEKNYIGYGASGRNAGFLLAGLAEPYSRLVVGMGRETARSITQSTLDNHDLMAEAITEKKISCDYIRQGSYHLAVTVVEQDELIESAKLLNRDGFRAEYIERGKIPFTEDKTAYLGGFFNPADGALDPYAFVTGLADNANIIEGFEVKEITKLDGHVRLLGRDGLIDAEMVVLATNAYSPLVDKYFDNLIFPVRGQMMATNPIAINKLGDSTYYSNFGYDYFRQANDSTVVMGGLRDKFVNEEVGYDDTTTPGLQRGLDDYIQKYLGIEKFDVVHRWSGVMGNTPDGLPLVGPLPHNNSVLAAVGYNGHGFGLGMVVARDLVNAIMKNETSDLLNRFSIKRFSK